MGCGTVSRVCAPISTVTVSAELTGQMMRAVNGDAALTANRSIAVSPRLIASVTASCSHSPSSWVVWPRGPSAMSDSSAAASLPRGVAGDCAAAIPGMVRTPMAATEHNAVRTAGIIACRRCKSRTVPKGCRCPGIRGHHRPNRHRATNPLPPGCSTVWICGALPYRVGRRRSPDGFGPP